MKHIEYPNLEPLFRPQSVAIIGASNDTRKASGLLVKNALDRSYKGKIFPINPKHETIQGLKSYPSILDIQEEVDVAIIVLPAAAVVNIVRQCAEKRVKALVIPVSGFAEAGGEGKKWQDEIEEISKRFGIRICGPNTNGLLNLHEGVALGYSYAQEVAIPGKLGYVSQSGALLSSTVPRFSQRGIGFSYFVAAGNQADLDVFDYAKYMLDDPNTSVLAIYLEGFKNPEKFLDVSDLALDKGKPIVIMKIGRSELSAKAAMSHTGSLAGSDLVFDAICKQKGLTRVDDLDSLISVSSVFLKSKLPKGDGIGIVSSSGAAVGLIADHAIKLGLRFPDLSPRTQEELLAMLPAYGEIKNPFDLGAAGSAALNELEHTKRTLELFAQDENIHIIVSVVHPMDRRATENYIQAIAEVSKATEKPIILFCPMGGLREGEAKIYAKVDIPMVMDADECVNAVAGLIRFSQAVKICKEPKELVDSRVSVSVEEIKESLRLGGKTLTEHESKNLLSRYGIATTEEAIAKSAEEAAQIAKRIGYPVALKIDSPGIIHKTDANAIRLNIRSETELIQAYQDVIANSNKYDPKADIRGVLVQEMIEGGREVIVGMSRDPQFGPVVMFGLGGVFVEVLKDISLRVAPLTRRDAEEMVREIKGYKILKAFRGKSEADLEGIIDTLLKVSKLSMDLGDVITEIDINPLIVLDRGKGVKVVDALVVL